MKKMTERQLAKWEKTRDLGQEILQGIQDIKAGRSGRRSTGDLPDRPSLREVGLVPSQVCRVAWGVGSYRPGLGARASGAERSGENLAQGSRVAPDHSEEDCCLRELRSNQPTAPYCRPRADLPEPNGCDGAANGERPR